MKVEIFDFFGSGGVQLPAVLWLPEEDPKLILQITHGMTEHMGRYASFARAMTARGIAVAGFDLRGHGKNPGDPHTASFGKGGWDASIGDMRQFYQMLNARFAEIPHVMLGFSLGSFLLREYLSKYPDRISGAVIMGTGNQPGWLMGLLQGIVKTQFGKDGFDQTTNLVRSLSFGAYNKKFKPNQTQADWLCADEQQLSAYLVDPMVRKDISAGLFWELLGSMKRTGTAKSYQNWNPNMPVLLLSGQEDPVGDAGKGVRNVRVQMEEAGLRNVSMELFLYARHDLLHEYSSDAAVAAQMRLFDWLEKIP